MSETPDYAPEVLEREFRRAGFEAWKRLFYLIWVFLALVIGAWWDARQEGQELARRQRARAIWLRETFVRLGATFIKIGQVLSTRPDLVPLAYVEEMAQLQDQVPPFDSEEAHRLIAAELGAPIDTLFEIFNPFPMAAASIGQVYKARLRDGTDVVVKVQRPGLIPVVCLDLAIMRRVAAWVDRHPKLSRGMPYTAIVDEFGYSLFDQADYMREGRYAERFRENFAHFPHVDTPRIHWALTTSKVMTMDFVHGMKPTDLVALEGAGIDFQEVVRLGVRATIKQLLEDGFFHADVHPGNLFVDYEGQLIFIDFGMSGELSSYTQEKIVDIFLHSVHRQYRALVQDFIDLGFLLPQVDKTALLPVAERIFTAQYGETDRRMTVKEIFTQVSTVLYEYPFRIPEKIAFILRTLITLEGIIHKLWPDFRFLEVAAPYAAKILLTDAKANIREKLVDELFVDGEFQPERLAKLFGTATREPTFRFGEVAPSVLRYLASPEGGRVRDGLLSVMGQGVLGETDFSWQVYVDKAAQDPGWSLDDLLLPVLQFLQTEDGVLFLIKLMDQRALMLGANGEAIASIGVALKGREVSPQLIDALMGALGNVLRHDEISLQPLLERASGFLSTPDGQGWFYTLGDYLAQHRDGVNAPIGDVLALAAQHPHLDIAPLVREFVTLVMRPQGRAWQEVLFSWVDRDGQKREGFLKALQPLLADGRLQLGELALPAMGFLFSKDGAPLRDEMLTSIRTRIRSVDLGGMAQGLWRAAGNAVQNALKPEPKAAP